MISKKDFVCVAENIDFTLRLLHGQQRVAAIKVVQAVADACRRLNANFDRSRFYEACGITQGDLK